MRFALIYLIYRDWLFGGAFSENLVYSFKGEVMANPVFGRILVETMKYAFAQRKNWYFLPFIYPKLIF